MKKMKVLLFGCACIISYLYSIILRKKQGKVEKEFIGIPLNQEQIIQRLQEKNRLQMFRVFEEGQEGNTIRLQGKNGEVKLEKQVYIKNMEDYYKQFSELFDTIAVHNKKIDKFVTLFIINSYMFAILTGAMLCFSSSIIENACMISFCLQMFFLFLIRLDNKKQINVLKKEVKEVLGENFHVITQKTKGVRIIWRFYYIKLPYETLRMMHGLFRITFFNYYIQFQSIREEYKECTDEYKELYQDISSIYERTIAERIIEDNRKK